MIPTEAFDAIVIGAGQAGGPLTTALARAGRRTALIEREHVGGTCINEGCTPTKTMVASARVAYLARRGADYGVHTGPITIDMARVRQRKRDIVASFRSGSESQIQGTPGVELIAGEAHFTDDHTLAVGSLDGSEHMLTAPLIIINTGEHPHIPAIPGLAEIPYLTSTTIMELDAVPEHLIVLGGGYVGLEFGQMFRRFGSVVTIIQHGAQLLSREDADVADAVAEILREDGIEVALLTEARQAWEDLAARQGPAALHRLIADRDLVAAAKIPATNVRRVIRALEVCIATGQPFSAQQMKRPIPYRLTMLGLTTERARLYSWADQRVDAMLAAGFVAEVQALVAWGFGWGLPAMSSLGYREIGAVLRGEQTLPDAIQRLKWNTHGFIRKQLIWFRPDQRIHWIDAAAPDRLEHASRFTDAL